jgi:hypothetical protein
VASFDEAIPPGKVGHVSVSLHTDNLKGAATKSVTVSTNDPTTPQIVLSVRVDVVASIEVLPYEMMQLRSRPGQTAAGRLLIRRDPRESGELKIADIQSSAAWLIVSAKRLSGPTPRGEDGLPPGAAGDWVLEAHLDESAPPLQGRRRENVRFSTGLSRQPTASVGVMFELKPPVNFAVERLILKPEPSGAAAGTLFASVREDLDPAALSIEARPSGLEAVAEPSASARIVTLRVRWPGGAPLAGGALILTVGREKVRLPVEIRGAATGAPAGAGRPRRRQP